MDAVDQARTQGRGYYPSLCYKVRVQVGDEEIEVGDGGFVDWNDTTGTVS